jgi:tyrosyl-DNA phosphodiesterase-1
MDSSINVQSCNDAANCSPEDERKHGNTSMTVKRILDDQNSFSNPSLKKRSMQCVETPIQLFATRLDERERQNHPQSSMHWSWTQTRTLREMLGFDSTTAANAVENDRLSCPQFLVISNFIVDFEFLLNEIPELLSISRVVVFYGYADNRPDLWKNAVASDAMVDFVLLDPTEQPQSPKNPLKYQFSYGCHHTKMFIVGYSNRVRVIIHTANLRDNDIHDKTQAAYIEDFSLKRTDVESLLERNSSTTDDDFENTLLYYLESYGYKKCIAWIEDGSESQTLLDCLKRYDFSSAKGILIPSVPGWHKLDGETHQRMGHWKLRHVVANYTVTSTKTSRYSPIVCQFSSIGLLSEKYLKDLHISMDTELSKLQDTQKLPKVSLRFQFVYPTVEEIRNSVEGYSGGCSVPGRVKNLVKPFVKPLLHRWTYSQSSSACSTGSEKYRFCTDNPLVRPWNVPHIKTYYQLSDDDNKCFNWFVLASHNMSKAAWGEVQNSKRFGTRQLFLSSWELGVFISPQTVQVDRLTYYSESLVSTTKLGLIPLPYPLHPQPYQQSDHPWAVDGKYTVPDRFGRKFPLQKG